MITRKDIYGVARLLIQERDNIQRDLNPLAVPHRMYEWREFVCRLASYLADNNPRFDTARFIRFIDEN